MTRSPRTAQALEALRALPPEELRERKQRAARASAAARRQIADEAVTITVHIRPAHALTPEQLAAWRSFWRAILATEPELPAPDGEEAGSDA
ncbi:hypothetical protein NET02_12665 [Thermomicrobiaceae bacterium CFH 74404]|uniref:Uncharacterized protein n=1 Tax=Thermalbibacter longus TaxID=2951981 RepID=A0AA42BAR2_9BACT|nr:hypothetical protein [Thermalbibacter longus]MCM8750002.1 hypothetical protein [Thermalbibacter longus]